MTVATTGPLLHDLITAQARRTPAAPAIRQWEHTLTYLELTTAANALAHRLREAGAGPETRVGVCGRRTPDLLVAVLGVLLSGAAYVPLDPSHPRGRLATVIDDARITTVVADGTGESLLAGLPVRLLPPRHGRRDDPPPPLTRPANAAYTLYTSGSTGRPKGVTVSHAAVVAFVTMAGEVFGLDAGCRSIGFAALGFDVSVLDVFAPLARGGSVAFIGDDDRVDPARLQKFLEHHHVTWGTIPPALLPLLDPAGLPTLRDLLTAGEPAGPEQVARWTRPGPRRFHNWYGPTETTVCVVGTELDGAWDRPLPIGHALPGCVARILDEDLRPCPPGTPGELCIGGPQLARGYLGRPGLTAERFVPDPCGEPGARLYRTGDRVALDADGRIAFLGRLDRQVKIQGQRVEIGEVEAVLRTHPAIRQAVADVTTGPAGLKELTAFLTPQDAPGLDGVRDHCRDHLPPYMIPTRVVRLPVLPMTVAGKVDLAALRGLTGRPTPADGGAPAGGPPRTPAERAVATAWARAFATAEPGRDDDFFAAGGHSLLAMRLTALLGAALRRRVAVEDVLAGRTVAGIARRAEQCPAVHDEPPAVAPAALSPTQRRMWFVERLAPGSPAHNIAMAQRLAGPLDLPALRAALAAVAERHEALRWRVPDAGGVPAVAVAPPGDVPLPVEDVTPEALADRLQQEARRPFELAGGPLWRARLLRLDDDLHVLAVTVHHIVFDGWSQNVLYRDISAAYRRERLDALPASAGGYTAWLAGRETSADLDWWAAALDGVPTVLDLPRDHPRPPVQTLDGAGVTAEADAALSDAVRRLAARVGGTPYTVMLAAFAQVLARLTGRRDLVVGTPVADRRHPALEPLAGCLVHVLPVRLRVDDDAGFDAHVTRCQDTLAGALAHLDVRLERLVDRLVPGRDLSRNPLVQVLFNMYDFAEPRLDLPGVRSEPLPPGLPGSLFDLTMYVAERDGRYLLQAVYNPRLYRHDRVEALLSGYLHLLSELVTTPDRPVGRARLRPLDGHAGAGDRPAPPAAALPDGGATLPPWDGPGLVESFLRQANAHPDRPAVTGEGGDLTYAELAALARAAGAAVTTALRPGGAGEPHTGAQDEPDKVTGAQDGPETVAGVQDERHKVARVQDGQDAVAGVQDGPDTVAVLAARQSDLPALLLGVLAAGARWAVLDAALPPARLAAQARAARARALITCHGLTPPAELAWLPRIPLATDGPAAVDGAGAGAAPPHTEGAFPAVPPGRRGYLAFTSGTTGDPKPVVTAEGPLARFLHWYPRTHDLTGDDRFALLAGLAHDPLLRDAFTPLTLGARLFVPAQDTVRDPARLAGWLRRHRITAAHLTPQLATLLTAAGQPLPDLRLVLFGGDRLTHADAARFRHIAPTARLLNTYGTTETPQVQAVHDIAEPVPGSGDPLPAGHGVDGAELLIVTPGGHPAAVGELGEVVIRSRRLARGYLDPHLTRDRFTTEPDGTGRYRTGDLGRYDPAGRAVLAGRADDQVKIRGHRVELGEIEHALLAHPGVRAAAVTATPAAGQPGGPVLRAYAVPAGPAVQAGELHRHLRATLPDHALPADVVLLPALPLTPNGKLDRAALPVPPPRAAAGGDHEPATGTERLLAGIWREILGLPRISATANFFDSGGHSLATAQVQARLAAALGRDVPIVDLFRFPTIRALAAHLDGERRPAGTQRAARRIAARRARPTTHRPHPGQTGE
ncbi:amino acid adenylation domain-containing protein [Nonomuraea indica]|uniref:Amino acid adenylation domain-containing protein n=1 Tax=Nonomuraea indica TaxID=1581193 RepID=A0ABW8A6Y1_9ACTN